MAGRSQSMPNKLVLTACSACSRVLDADEAGVRDELRAYVLQCLNPPSRLQIGEQSRDVPEIPFPVYVIE
jgi:hypothetical protein